MGTFFTDWSGSKRSDVTATQKVSLNLWRNEHATFISGTRRF
jgi:hypothetical protein